ncbi:MAG: hypothetical protein MEQ07_10480 [Aquimonas sp.]|nr:hypothetical protein [Aquimonas sp.]
MSVRRPLWLLSFALSTAFVATSCGAVAPAVAERCVLVDLQQLRGKELLPSLQQFAIDHRLAPNLSHPLSSTCVRGDVKRPRAIVVYTQGLGEFGSALALFRFEQEKDADLVAAIDGFIEERLVPRYGVTRCADVPGFQVPSMQR